MTTVAVCIPTWRRPTQLGALLDRLAEPGVADPGATAVRFVVVDNDAEGSAAEVVRDRGPALPGPVDYVVEPRRGLASVRNRAVGEALRRGADAVAFVDDDELPAPGWLPALVGMWRTTGAPVVAGPVVRAIDDPAKAWLGPFFEEPRFADGADVLYATTANVLVAAELLQVQQFETAFDRTGGEDTLFFERVRLAGRRMVWADGAVVHEPVVAERATLRWVLRREYRRGTTLSLCLRATAAGPARVLKRLAAVVVHLTLGLATTVGALRHGRVAAARGLHRICFGLGLLAGLLGHRYEEYGGRKAKLGGS